MASSRTKPNIIITGTPGVGKSSHAELLAAETGLTYLSINDVAKNNDCYESFDKELDTHIIDEDRVLDAVTDRCEAGGNVIDWHVCDIFPERWIDLVVVLRADTAVLYDRLKRRTYSEKKLQENMDAEIMQVILDDANEAYAQELVIELKSDDPDQMEANVKRIAEWTDNWLKDHPDGV